MSPELDALADLRAELVEAELVGDASRLAKLRARLGEALTPQLLADLLDGARRCEVHEWRGRVRAPFPYYGGKYGAAGQIEAAMGEIVNLVIYGLDDPSLSPASRAWALEHGGDPRLRIVVCGIEGEHAELEEHGWTRLVWRKTKRPECLWLSPHCKPAPQLGLFEEAAA